MTHTIDLKQVGERIRTAREQQGYTQAELGTFLGLQAEDIAHLEQGEAILTLQCLLQLSNLLNQSPLYFLGCEPEEILLVTLYRALPPGLPRSYLLNFVQSWVEGKKDEPKH